MSEGAYFQGALEVPTGNSFLNFPMMIQKARSLMLATYLKMLGKPFGAIFEETNEAFK